jgi:WhiB family redox-sensing transcriptional regulator
MSNPYEFPDLTNGLCVGIDTELFFPDSGVNQFSDQMKTIRKMCAECPVVNACLTYALHVEVDGVWAGTGVNQRRLLRRDLGIKAVQIHTQYTSDAMMGQSKSAKEARARRARRLAEKEQVA